MEVVVAWGLPLFTEPATERPPGTHSTSVGGVSFTVPTHRRLHPNRSGSQLGGVNQIGVGNATFPVGEAEKLENRGLVGNGLPPPRGVSGFLYNHGVDQGPSVMRKNLIAKKNRTGERFNSMLFPPSTPASRQTRTVGGETTCFWAAYWPSPSASSAPPLACNKPRSSGSGICPMTKQETTACPPKYKQQGG